MRSQLWVCLLLVLSLFGAPSAFAQEDPDSERARECYERGQRYYDIGNYDRALEEFKQGYLLSGIPAFLLNMAQAYRMKGDDPSALDYYKRFLAKADSNDPQRPNVEKIVADMESGVLKTKTTPALDSGLTQDEIKQALGPDYNNYVSSGLTYDGYTQYKKGKKQVYIGSALLVGGVVGGLALIGVGSAAESDFTGKRAMLGLGYGVLLVGGYGGYYTLSAGSKKVQEGKQKQRSNTLRTGVAVQ